MNVKNILVASVALSAAAALGVANAGEKKVEHTCVCSWNGEGPMPPMPPVPPEPPVPPTPPPPGAHWESQGPPGSPEVHVFRRHGDGDDDERIFIYRTLRDHHDGADANKDGKVTKREFMDRAEKRFKDRDKNNDGTLDKGETMPEPFTMPVPPMPPEPPEE